MENQIIRKVTVGSEPKEALYYVEGGIINIHLNQKSEQRRVSNIQEENDFIYIHIASGTESQLWKRIPSWMAMVEFVVD